MISIIKNLFKVGDKIVIVCTDGSKIEGSIHTINDNLIILKDDKNLIKGIKGSMIEYFEQPETSASTFTIAPAKPKQELKIIDKIPLETLFKNDPKGRERYLKNNPNAIKQETSSDNGSEIRTAEPTPTSDSHETAKNNDASDYLNKVDEMISRKKIDEAIAFIDGLVSNWMIPSVIKSELLLKKSQVLFSNERPDESLKAYTELIQLNKKIGAKDNYISNLYTELSKMQMQNTDTLENAFESITLALKYDKNNEEANQIKEKINNLKTQKEDAELASAFIIDITDDAPVPSKMIKIDIEEHRIDNPKILNISNYTAELADSLLEDAKEASKVSKTQSYLLFLDAAKIYSELQAGSYEYQNYLYAMAFYARLKADSLYAKYENYSHTDNPDKEELLMVKDSACCYYRESLDLISHVAPDSLVDIITNLLRLEISQIQIENKQKASFGDDLKTLLDDCIRGGDLRKKSAAVKMILSCGGANVKVWNAICESGTIGFLLTDTDVRRDIYDTINTVGHTNIDKSLELKDYLKEAFNLWKRKEQDLIEYVKNLEFNIRSMAVISQKWDDLIPYEHLFLYTDIESKNVVDKILKILRPYLNRNQVERTNLLISTQRIIDAQLKYIENHTTYVGRAFFFVLFNNWKKEIDDLISDKIAKSYPAMSIVFDPPFYVRREDNKRLINLAIQNVGETTAEGCHMTAIVESDKIDINKLNETIEIDINEELPSGAKIGYQLVIPEDLYPKADVLYVTIKIYPIYLGKKMETKEFSSTIEEESNYQLTYDDILWKDGPIPEFNLFKGRQQYIQDLSQHYLSVEKDKPYILYGLTRTGKSSILKFLKENIEGNTFKQGGKELMVCPIQWDFSEAASLETKDDFWDYMINGTLMVDLNAFAQKQGFDISDIQLPAQVTAKDFSSILNKLKDKTIYPLFLVDEFSFVKTLIDDKIVNNAFLHTLRQFSLEKMASFLFAGTYDIKALIKDPKYGITGQLVNAISCQVNEIMPQDAEELMNVMGEKLRFTSEAIQHIHKLSGDIPYFIQIICKYCGYYASDNKRSVIGYPELEKVIEILAGEKEPYKKTLLAALSEYTFQNNQYSPLDPPEVGALISSIVYINQNNKLNPRGVGWDEIERLWEQKRILNKNKLNNAFQILTEKKVLVYNKDDGYPVYSLSVDLFRRWWTIAHPDFNLEISQLK